jgi:hypothetical protein
MKKILLIISIFLLNIPSFAQAPDIMWTKTYGGINEDQGYSVQQTLDGGYIITGRTTSFGAGQCDVWLIKTDPLGDTLWARTFGGSNWDEGYCVKQTSDGGFIIIGEIQPNPSAWMDIFLIRTDINGDTLWTKTIGGNSSDIGRYVIQTMDGGFIFTGHWASSNLLLSKVDANGNLLWIKTLGGIHYQGGYSVQQTSDSGYVVIGTNSSGKPDIWLIKTNSYGDTLWTKTFGENEFHEEARSVEQTIDGGFILGGSVSYGEYHSSIWLIKTDSYGDTLWTKTYDRSFQGYLRSLKKTTDDGYVIVGDPVTSHGWGWLGGWLIRTDSNGDSLWTKTLECTLRDVSETSDGGFILTGYYGDDVVLIKLAPDSALVNIDDNHLEIISDYSLSQNFPNPYNPTTTIKYQIPELSFVTLKVYDLLGNEVVTLVNEEKPVGSYNVKFDATTLPSGVYFYQLRAGSFVETKKMVLLR